MRKTPTNRSRMARGWLRWLTPGLEVKRWLLLLMIGILVIDLGLAYALKALYSETQGLPAVTYYLTLQFIPKLVRAFLFGIVGLALLAISIVMLQRSVLGPLLPGSGRSMAEVIYAFRTRNRGPRIVAIGGGTGMSTLLRGLKDHTANLAAVVTVADDGGSSGRLREEYRILPPGDFRQCLVALADAEPLVKQLFNHRFQEGSLSGHSFGNLFIMAMAEVTGSFEHALRESGRVLAVRGSIVPSTLHDVTLVADVNGSLIEGESKIPSPGQPITRVHLKPDDAELNPDAKAAILAAEMIVCGPGSLYTSVLPNLLVPGMVRAIAESAALKVYVCNVAEQYGETDHFTVADHMRVLKEHVGDDIFDFVVVNSNLSHDPTGGQQNVRFDRHPAQVLAPTARFIGADVVNTTVPSHHDPEKLADVLMRRIWSA